MIEVARRTQREPAPGEPHSQLSVAVLYPSLLGRGIDTWRELTFP